MEPDNETKGRIKTLFKLPFILKKKTSVISVIDADPAVDNYFGKIPDDLNYNQKDSYQINLNEIMDDRPNDRKKIRKLMSHYLSVSTIHGLSSLHRAKTFLLKLMWILFICISIGGCAFFVVETINSFMDFNYFTLGKIVTKSFMKFPAVTVCSKTYIDTNIKRRMYSCMFENQVCNYTEFSKVTVFDPYFTIDQFCYTFNGGRNYTNDKIELRKSYKSGYNSGLKLNLCIKEGDEILLYVHDNEIKPFFENYDIIQEPGTKTNIVLAKSVIKRLGEPYNRCTKITSNEADNSMLINQLIKDGYPYQQMNCYNLCYYEYLAINCNCTFNQLESNGLEICFKNKCFKNLYNEQDFDYESNCQNRCPLECESSILTKTYKTANYPPKSLNNEIINGIYNNLDITINKTQIKQRVLEFNVYFLDFGENVVEHVPQVTISGLVSNIGGTFGLFLGSSLISFVEIIEILIQFLIILKK